MLRFRYILTSAILLATLAGGVAAVARLGWSVNPIAPDTVLVVSDGLMPFNQRGMMLGFLATGNRPIVQRMVAMADLPDGRLTWINSVTYGVFYRRYPADSIGQVDRLRTRLMLSPQLGFGPLTSAGTIFVVRSADQFVAVDLEGIRVDGRYELELAQRDWLARQLGDRTSDFGELSRAASSVESRAVYLADVSPRQYNELRAELAAGGWPAGPLVAWKFTEEGSPRSAKDTVAYLQRNLGNKWILAVIGRMKDNQQTCAFGPADKPIVKTIAWPGGLAGRSGP